MLRASDELRTRAELLHTRVTNQDPVALGRLRRWRVPVEDVQRRHCLTVIAREAGFTDWPHAKRVLDGGDESDFGSLLFPPRCDSHLNNWFRNHDEAAAVHTQVGGYLLAYKRQFVVVDRFYIEALGLDPDDPDWNALGFDWSRPEGGEARARLYAKLVAALPREAA